MSAIRPATVQDLPGAYRVCLETGDSGADATGRFRNADLLGHVYVGPYIVGQPDLALVVADSEGIAGYALAAQDTRTFESWAEVGWWPALRDQYPATDGETPDDEVIRLLRTPPRSPDDIVVDYPSHLHIDLLPRVQRRGLGRALIERLVADLRAAGSTGVHLLVGSDNANAIAFYRHLGFADLTAEDGGLLMGMRLVSSD